MMLLRNVTAFVFAFSASTSADVEVMKIDLRGCKAEGGAELKRVKYTPPVGKAREAVRLTSGESISMPAQLDFEYPDVARVGIRLFSATGGEGLLTFDSGPGSFKKIFRIELGEQVILMPLGTFKRVGEPAGWNKIDGVTLEVSETADTSVVDVLSIDAFPASSEVFKGALFLFRKDGAAEHPGGVAWPLYAILADGTTSGLEGNLKRLFGIAVPVNPESLSRDENVPHNVFVVGADVGVKSGSLTSTEIGEQATVGLLFERRMAVSLSPGRADTALHTG